jgi:tRNA(His) 5'-end guanylyltransferase
MTLDIGDRFKTNYEAPACHHLTRRTPVVVRVDGRAFHTFTRNNFKRPFAIKFHDSMVGAALYVASQMQGFKLGYVQSDEVSFLLTDYDNFQTEPWFGYRKSKVETISASLMTAAFARCMRLVGITDLATFDARAFNVPESEVVNYFLWRAQDWARNSVNMYAQAHFSHQLLQKCSCTDMHEMLYSKGLNWVTDLMENERNGTYLVGDSERTDILPNYTAIETLWNEVKP